MHFKHAFYYQSLNANLLQKETSATQKTMKLTVVIFAMLLVSYVVDKAYHRQLM